MIHPRPYGHDLDIIRRDGHTQLYRIVSGQECAALKAIFTDHVFGRLDEHEAGLLLKGVNQILGNEPRAAAPADSAGPVLVGLAALRGWFGRLVGGFVRVMGFDEACEMGGGK